MKGDFLDFFFLYDIQHCFLCHPSDSTVSEDAGIEPSEVKQNKISSMSFIVQYGTIYCSIHYCVLKHYNPDADNLK